MEKAKESRPRPITLTIKSTGEEYLLDFNRETAIFTNRSGFRIEDFVNNMEEMLPILFYGSFRKNHKEVTKYKADKILTEDLKGLSESAVERLLELYSAGRKSLIYQDEAAEDLGKNPNATVQL